MDKKEYYEKIKLLQRGDFIFVRVIPEYAEKAGVTGIAGSLIQYGTGYFCHTEVYYGNKDGQKHTVITANGEKVTWDCLDRYVETIPKAYKLVVKRIKKLEVNDIDPMVNEMFRQIGIKYDKGQLAGLAFKGFLTKIPVLGFFINKFIWKVGTPFSSAEKLICSESACLIGRAPKLEDGNSKYPLCKDYDLQSVTPSILAEDRFLETVVEI